MSTIKETLTEQQSHELALKKISDGPKLNTTFNTKPRVTVVESVYHQHPEEDPICIDTKFDRFLNYIEQPYIRKVYLHNEWTPLDTGWIKSSSLLVLTNEKNKSIQVKLTQQEQELANELVIEVAMLSSIDNSKPRDMHSDYIDNSPRIFSIILPGESIRINPTDPKAIVLRCRSGSVKCSIALFPA